MKKYNTLSEKIDSLLNNGYVYENTTDEDFLDEASKKMSSMTPEQKADYGAKASKWHSDHPVDHMNIVNHYNKATPMEKSSGHDWYENASRSNRVIGEDAGVSKHTMAGLISNYSPQTDWHQNMHTSSMVARSKVARGGKGDGVMASSMQKAAAQKLLNGESYNSVLKGQKTKAFAHLVEHGKSEDPSNPQVVIDRHAHSVASGARITDAAFSKAGLKSPKTYNKISQAYKDAADHLSKQHGHEIRPEQVQATTWLVRQRLNAHEENAATKNQAGGSKTAKRAEQHKANFEAYAGEHHPRVLGMLAKSGYVGIQHGGSEADED